MKNQSFIEKYSKWIVRFLVIVGLGLIYKLWAVGLYISDSCSGGYISLCIGWDIDYYWISASTIALIFFIVSFFLIKKIKQTKDNDLKVKMALIIFVLGIIGTPIFYTISPDFKFYLQKAEYKDSKGNITDIDKYLELTNKYCRNDIEGDDFDFIYPREIMCSGKFETDFDNVEDYIKILDFANKNDNKYLYQHTFRWIDENVGLENMIEEYDDDTFYAYVILGKWTNIDFKELIRSKTTNKIFLLLLDYIDINLLEYYKNNETNNRDKYYEWDKIMNQIELEIEEKIKQIPEVNQKIF